MDDCCAVCAESLEWVAYGACGHKDVCSTCVARLRFICDDRRCCICKSASDVVFVTKALGDYTETISDFSVLPSNLKEGRVEQYWYHEDTQAFFDDMDHYKMIKAMCRLSCGVCDKVEDHSNDGSRKRVKFKNIEQLRAHLFHKHRLRMCILCLQGRKVFICEQKLYTKSQLDQHTSTGDSEVDGTESERGGFMGHPKCEFCRTSFYGDNELYTHMSTEHYACHICQRRYPGQYEYYKNYDDLEIHFRRDHFICEDEDCLAKKFVVFQSEAELKRHNTLEHGGRMSRSKRSAALQIPTSFRYQRRGEQDHRRGRERPFQRDLADNGLALAIQESLDMTTTRDSTDRGEITDAEALVPPMESLGVIESERTSRYLQALSHNSTNASLGEISFPPLPMNPGSSQQNSHPDVLPKKTMAEHLRHQGSRKKNASSSSSSWVAGNNSFSQSKTNSYDAWPTVNDASGSTSTPGPSGPATEMGRAPSACSVAAQSRPSPVTDSSFADSVISSRMSGSTSRISHSLSAPNLSDQGYLESSLIDFPPVSAAQTRNIPAIDHSVVRVTDVQTANKSLVHKIHLALGFDDEKYTAFKEVSNDYRQGSMVAETYLSFAVQFNLSHLVPELARLLPDAQKQKELMEAYHANLSHISPRETGLYTDSHYTDSHVKDGSDSKKGKGISTFSGNGSTKDILADKVMSTVKELQSSYRDTEVVDILSKDGYRFDRGKSKAVVDDHSQLELSGTSKSLKSKSESSAIDDNQKKAGNSDGKSKQRKKTSKFHRVRLGDGSIEALLDPRNEDDPDSGPNVNSAATNEPDKERLPARGVWRNGGGQKLLSVASKESRK